MPEEVKSYRPAELKILHYLKEHGPLTADPSRRNGTGILPTLERAIGLSTHGGTISDALKILEQQSVILRTYADSHGPTRGSRMIRLELVDPDMALPPLPPPSQRRRVTVINPAVIMARENREMYRTHLSVDAATHAIHSPEGPAESAVILALLARNDELQEQVAKLREMVDKLADENADLKRQLAARENLIRERIVREPGLKQRIRGALTEEQWKSLYPDN